MEILYQQIYPHSHLLAKLRFLYKDNRCLFLLTRWYELNLVAWSIQLFNDLKHNLLTCILAAWAACGGSYQVAILFCKTSE